jgi:hypothetical protein
MAQLATGNMDDAGMLRIGEAGFGLGQVVDYQFQQRGGRSQDPAGHGRPDAHRFGNRDPTDEFDSGISLYLEEYRSVSFSQNGRPRMKLGFTGSALSMYPPGHNLLGIHCPARTSLTRAHLRRDSDVMVETIWYAESAYKLLPAYTEAGQNFGTYPVYPLVLAIVYGFPTVRGRRTCFAKILSTVTLFS